MLDAIYIGMSGLTGFAEGLRVIANNTANLNTPGFKGSTLQFSDLFTSGGGSSGGGGQVGHGVGTTGTTLNFTQGDVRQTGNDLDLAIDGDGLFTIKDSLGKIHYTRDGRFQFDNEGTLVSVADGSKVMALAADGSLTEISVADLRTSTGKATSTVKFNGNLPSGATTQTVSGINVFDSAGGSHNLSLVFTNTGTGTGTIPGSWDVSLMDGATTVGFPQQVLFTAGRPSPGSMLLTFSFTPAGLPPMAMTFDFTAGVTSFASTDLPALAMGTQDGFSAAALTRATFDATGTLALTYGNGQAVKGARLALARFDSPDAVNSIGGGRFDVIKQGAWHTGVAAVGAFGSITADQVEISNVDMSQEFSNLVIMQRGYQASSQIISTANDMLQELFTMKGK